MPSAFQVTPVKNGRAHSVATQTAGANAIAVQPNLRVSFAITAAKIAGKTARIAANSIATAYAMTVSISPKLVIECAIQFSAKKVNSIPASQPSHKARRTVTPSAITFNKGASATQARKLNSNGGNERINKSAETTAVIDCHNRPSDASENRESDRFNLINAGRSGRCSYENRVVHSPGFRSRRASRVARLLSGNPDRSERPRSRRARRADSLSRRSVFGPPHRSSFRAPAP